MKRNFGFTLLELMATIAVLGVVVGIAIPSFSQMITKNRIETTAYEVLNTVQAARSEAVKRKRSVRICAAKNAQMDECDNLSNWEFGWLLVLHSDNTVLKSWQNTSNVTVTGPTAGIKILSSGMLDNSANVEVTAPNCGAGQKRTISINRIGNTTLTQGNC